MGLISSFLVHFHHWVLLCSGCSGTQENTLRSHNTNPDQNTIGALQFLWSFRMDLCMVSGAPKHHYSSLQQTQMGSCFLLLLLLMQAMLPYPYAWPVRCWTDTLLCPFDDSLPSTTLSRTQPLLSLFPFFGVPYRARRMARSFGDAPAAAAANQVLGISCVLRGCLLSKFQHMILLFSIFSRSRKDSSFALHI